MTTPSRGPAREQWLWLAIPCVLLVTAGLLRLEGRRWWCACGQPFLWTADAWGSHNSQHLLDPYSLTHLLHGVVLYGLLTWACPRLPQHGRLFLGFCLEALWELLENSPFVIARYRATTAALGYEGDTVANSLGDIVSCVCGLLLARRLGLWKSVAVFVLVEGILLLWIRDSLLLNVIMLIHPLEPIKQWQMGP
jgi:hypothetical protein